MLCVIFMPNGLAGFIWGWQASGQGGARWLIGPADRPDQVPAASRHRRLRCATKENNRHHRPKQGREDPLFNMVCRVFP